MEKKRAEVGGNVLQPERAERSTLEFLHELPFKHYHSRNLQTDRSTVKVFLLAWMRQRDKEEKKESAY